MKLLAIHSNHLFFRRNAPNVYAYLAGERNQNYSTIFDFLDEEYREKRNEGPLLLREVFTASAKGLTGKTFNGNCQRFWREFQLDDISERLGGARENFDVVIVFTSYPKAVYEELLSEGRIDGLFGVEAAEYQGKIVGMKSIALKNEKQVLLKMERIGLEEKTTKEPNRYGLLELLIDQMIGYGLGREDVTIVGSGVTAEPMRKVSGRQVQDFSKL